MDSWRIQDLPPRGPGEGERTSGPVTDPATADAASAAERAFVERVRSDRARDRALLRRSVFTGVALVVAIGVLVVAGGIPRSYSLGNVPTGSAVTRLAPTVHPTPTRETPGATSVVRASPSQPGFEALEGRVARLEGRLGVLEDRTVVVEDRVQRSASGRARATPRSSVNSPKPTESPRTTGAATPQPSKVKAAPALSTKRSSVVSPARETTRRPDTPQGLAIGDRFRRGWETIERHVRRTPDEVREQVSKVKRLLAG